MEDLEENSSIIEWTIENFTCWNYEIHGAEISLPKVDFLSTSEDGKFIKLFPRGTSGKGNNIMVKIYNPRKSCVWELSFISSNGSLMKETIKEKMNLSTIFLGPIYEKVVEQIREFGHFHEDVLTLQIREKFRRTTSIRNARTVIDVLNTSLKLNSSIYKDINKCTWDRISNIQYPIDGSKDRNLHVYTKRGFCNELSVKLRSYADDKETILVQTSVSFDHTDEAILKREILQHIFTGRGEWIIPMKSFPVKDLIESTYIIRLNLKIISENPPKTYSHRSRCLNKLEVSRTNTVAAPGDSYSHKATNAFEHQSKISKEVLTKDLMHLYQNREFSDLEIRCGDVILAVHSGILSARSPVFRTLLSTDMMEAASGLIDIKDLDYPTLTHFLRFLYSGTLDDLQSDSAMKLYYAADKYQVPTLKRECVSVLCAEVSISNVCEILSLEDRHPDDQLRSAVHDFIVKNYNRVLASKEWRDFMTVDPMLLLKTVTIFAEEGHVGKINQPRGYSVRFVK